MAKTEVVYLAAGCFWGVQYYLDQIPGVTRTVVGYIGGHTDQPTYEQVCTHTTGHAEAVEVEYDPVSLSTEMLLRHFFRLHDPTQLNRQGPDVGDNYRSAIFYTTDEQKATAEAMITELTANKTFSSPIVTEVAKAPAFWPAEVYHQKYTERTGHGMCHVPYQALR